MVLVNPFLRFTKTADFFTKILGLKGKGFLNDFWVVDAPCWLYDTPLDLGLSVTPQFLACLLSREGLWILVPWFA